MRVRRASCLARVGATAQLRTFAGVDVAAALEVAGAVCAIQLGAVAGQLGRTAEGALVSRWTGDDGASARCLRRAHDLAVKAGRAIDCLAVALASGIALDQTSGLRTAPVALARAACSRGRDRESAVSALSSAARCTAAARRSAVPRCPAASRRAGTTSATQPTRCTFAPRARGVAACSGAAGSQTRRFVGEDAARHRRQDQNHGGASHGLNLTRLCSQRRLVCPACDSRQKLSWRSRNRPERACFP